MVQSRFPTLFGEAWLTVRQWRRRALRWMADRREPIPKHLVTDATWPVAASVRSPLYLALGDEAMEDGKVQNLRVAAKCLDWITVPAGQTFSFWRQVGRCHRRKGYVAGRQLQEGCLIPAVGGGLCQLTNALYQAAMAAGLEIVERHAHSSRVPGSSAEAGRDATVAWNYVDLRLRSISDWQLRVRLTADELVVEIRMPSSQKGRVPLRLADQRRSANSCASCGETDCRRHEGPRETSRQTVYLLDGATSDFRTWVARQPDRHLLLTPGRGSRYDWGAFDATAACPIVTAYFGFLSRRLSEQGAARQSLYLRRAESLANRLARQIPISSQDLVIGIGFLPFLWQSGVLGGRRFRVLMHREPMGEIHRRLDMGYAAHPDSRTLGDFRAPANLVIAERDALLHAQELIWPTRRECQTQLWRPGDRVLFPGPTAGRKGAYEVREAARRLSLKLRVVGPQLEGSDFWEGLDVEFVSRHLANLDGCWVVVQPALIEVRPDLLRRAVASGVPTITTEYCRVEGATIVAALDADALIEALNRVTPGS